MQWKTLISHSAVMQRHAFNIISRQSAVLHSGKTAISQCSHICPITGFRVLPAISKRCFHRNMSLSSVGPKKELFTAIDGHIDTSSPQYLNNVKKNTELTERYNEMMRTAMEGRSSKAVERHTVRNKKILATERLKMLFDDDSDTLELQPLAGLDMPYGDIHRAGVITAIGKVHGIYCIATANDATIKAGTVYPITLKKQLRAQEISMQNGLPAVAVVDSGGAFLPMQAEIFPDARQGGRTFYNQAVSNASNIPLLAVVCGSCTAGAAYIPTMAQEAIIVDGIGTIFLAGPPLVFAALGEKVKPEDLGGGRVHSCISGCTDYLAANEVEAFEMSRLGGLLQHTTSL